MTAHPPEHSRRATHPHGAVTARRHALPQVGAPSAGLTAFAARGVPLPGPMPHVPIARTIAMNAVTRNARWHMRQAEDPPGVVRVGLDETMLTTSCLAAVLRFFSVECAGPDCQGMESNPAPA